MLHPIKDRCRRNIRHLFPRISCRVLSQYIRNHAVFVLFDDAADERQVPESLKNTTAGHDPCRVGKEVHFVKKEKLTDRCLLISACLQKETGFSDKQHVLNEDSVEKREQYPQEKQKKRGGKRIKEGLVDSL